MASATSGKARPRAVNHCPYCGTTISSPWQGRKTVTVYVVVLLLVVGFIGGRLLASGDVQLVEERRRLQQEQGRLRQEQQQLATERQQLDEERKQLAAAKPPEHSRVAGGDSVAPKTEPQPRQETPVAVGIPPATPPVQPPTGKVWQNSIGIEFVLIPAGEFLMGSERVGDEAKPVHRVRISQAFYLGKYEVTQAQWQAVMGANPSGFKGDTLPVEQV